MIRRLFWLTLGAVLGISAYRRVTVVARAILPGPRAREIASFAGDVREGMEIYRQRQLQAARPALEARTDHTVPGQPVPGQPVPDQPEPDQPEDGR
jgi:hypothetical protein